MTALVVISDPRVDSRVVVLFRSTGKVFGVYSSDEEDWTDHLWEDVFYYQDRHSTTVEVDFHGKPKRRPLGVN